MICIAMVNSAYPFCYDVTTVLGRYFHAQKEVATTLLTSKLSATYGTNRSLPNGLYCILPMLIEAGFITRPRAGVYQISHLVSQTDIAKSIYQKSFLANNPTLSEDYHFSNHFYLMSSHLLYFFQSAIFHPFVVGLDPLKYFHEW